MAALCDRPQPYGHFLNVVGYGPQQDQEPDQTKAKLCAGDRVSGDAAGVVVGHHNNDAWPGYQEIQTQCLENLFVSVVESGKNVHDNVPRLTVWDGVSDLATIALSAAEAAGVDL
jgi:hypothetical protein